jgi:predicted TIM-barrel fold metal-dependent hydrolase
MIVDIHTHIFPEKIASRSITSLEEKAGINATTNGMLSGLQKSAIDAGIDYSVVMPVVTKVEQFDSVNKYAAYLNENCQEADAKIISFGGIHPDDEDYISHLKAIKDMGIKGIKLHPDYQRTMIDDKKYLNIIYKASELDLAILVHAGVDIGLPELVHCPPNRAFKMLKETQAEKVILAHYGGYEQWDLVEEYLVGEKVYFDTSFLVGRIDEEHFLRIAKKHGTDKILFGSDSPWTSQKDSLKFIKNLNLDEQNKEQILGFNAKNLLGI